jgi:molybdate-binding protein/DNA-binding XRE family transcriptional regulator
VAKPKVESRLKEIRQGRGIGALELSRRLGISRQTVYAIEVGTYVPNTELALRLSRELEVGVEDLFSLAKEEPRKADESVAAELLSTTEPSRGQSVRLCQIGSKWIGVPVSAIPYYMPEADGIVREWRKAAARADKTQVDKIDTGAGEGKRIVVAGCDPATSLLSHMVERASEVEILAAAASSRLALRWLKEGKVHIAGSHLEDPATGEFNLPFVREAFPSEPMTVVTFARWEEGFVVAPGNPHEIHKVEDLCRKGVRFVNRETGSGSRALLDRLMTSAGMQAMNVHGYGRTANGHLAAAYAVLLGDAEACLATRSAAQAFGLGFVPLHTARYDLVMRQSTAGLPGVEHFLDVLQRAALRRKLELLAGYDTSSTGSLVA